MFKRVSDLYMYSLDNSCESYAQNAEREAAAAFSITVEDFVCSYKILKCSQLFLCTQLPN